jgi:hypothetical protein
MNRSLYSSSNDSSDWIDSINRAFDAGAEFGNLVIAVDQQFQREFTRTKAHGEIMLSGASTSPFNHSIALCGRISPEPYSRVRVPIWTWRKRVDLVDTDLVGLGGGG